MLEDTSRYCLLLLEAGDSSGITKIIHKLLAAKGHTSCNSVAVPYVISGDLSAQRPEEEQANKKAFQRNAGTLRFIADTTHPGIAWITCVLGRHLHDSAPRHMAALKPIYRFLSSRVIHGPRYEARNEVENVRNK